MDDRIAASAPAVDEWLSDAVGAGDHVLDAALAAADSAGLPRIEVAPNAGKFLQLLVRMTGARRVLEIGTLAGYSAIWMARALPRDGRLVTLERDADTAAVARANLDAAGVGGLVDIRIGQAADTLADLLAGSTEPFDLVFVDADKRSNPSYLNAAIRLGHPGTVVVIDNVVRDGAILAEPDGDDRAAADVRGTREALRMIGTDPRIDGTALQTVGLKGWDGFAVAVVR